MDGGDLVSGPHAGRADLYGEQAGTRRSISQAPAPPGEQSPRRSHVPPQSANSDRPSAEKHANASRAEFGFLGLIASTMPGLTPKSSAIFRTPSGSFRRGCVDYNYKICQWAVLDLTLCFLATPHEMQRPKDVRTLQISETAKNRFAADWWP